MVNSVRPDWLRRNAADPLVFARMKQLVDSLQLHTVCQSARCPNQGECFARGVATLMILGAVCTRNCAFCAVDYGRPAPPDPDEPGHVVAAVKKLGLRHVVITSVTRDDLPDGGADHFAEVIEAIRSYHPAITVEVLTPDFQGSLSALAVVVASRPAIINHNLETVPRLYRRVRPQAGYRRSLRLLQNVKLIESELLTKSGLMLGLGEKPAEVIRVMQDLREVDCDFLTIGQYLRPSLDHHRVVSFVSPLEFEKYRDTALAMGFRGVASAPLVRSSFQADKMFREIRRPRGDLEG